METIDEAIMRIAEDNKFKIEAVKMVYSSTNGNEKETIDIINIASKNNISLYDLCKALYPPSKRFKKLFKESLVKEMSHGETFQVFQHNPKREPKLIWCSPFPTSDIFNSFLEPDKREWESTPVFKEDGSIWLKKHGSMGKSELIISKSLQCGMTSTMMGIDISFETPEAYIEWLKDRYRL